MKNTAVILSLAALLSTSASAQLIGVSNGTTSVDLDNDLLATIGWSVTGAADTVAPAAGFDVGFDILDTSTFTYEADPFAIISGDITHAGTVTLTSDGTVVPAGSVTVGNFTITSSLEVVDTFLTGTALFTASPSSASGLPFFVTGDLLITEALSGVLVGDDSLIGVDAGDFQVAAIPEPSIAAVAGVFGVFLVLMARRRRAV